MYLNQTYFLTKFIKLMNSIKLWVIKFIVGMSSIYLMCFSMTAAAANTPESVSLSPYSLFQHADIIVKTVIILLLLASISSWILWVGKKIEISKKNKLILQSLNRIETLEKLDSNVQLSDHAANLIYQAAQDEYHYARQKTQHFSRQSIKERVTASIERIIASEKHHLSLGISFLATTGAIAPFVGLLGTVWGIMHSFVAIAQTNTTNLSVVAPGIAEALFATALGLFAAIPAVILYNSIVRSIAHHTLLVEDSATGILNLLSRELDDLQSDFPPVNRQRNKDLIAG